MVSMQITEEEKEFYQKIANDREISLSNLMKEGIKIFSNFSPFLLNKIEDLSKKLNIPEWLIIEIILLKELGYRNASKEIFGYAEIDFLNSFILNEAGFLKGQQLYEILFDRFKRVLEFQKKNLKKENINCPTFIWEYILQIESEKKKEN